jgi:hypothetical protein
LLKDVHSAGFKLSAVLPLVLKAYWKALDAGDQVIQAMQDSLSALEREAAPAAAAEAPSTASRKLLSAADRIDVLLSVLAELRRQVLQAIADSERGFGEASSTHMGLERARRGILETLSLLESGNAAAASRAQQASRRSIADGASALRARIGRLVLPGAPEGAATASGGTAWQVLTRGAPLPAAVAAYLEDPREMPFPAGFRELLKVYFKAILEARP